MDQQQRRQRRLPFDKLYADAKERRLQEKRQRLLTGLRVKASKRRGKQ